MQRLSAGQKFHRYTIGRFLGRGISGESYEAEDTLLRRKVTLKLIHPWSLLPDASRRQFFRSMQGMSFITHNSLAAILDYGEVDRQLYVARQYSVSGSLLSDNGRQWYRPPLPLADAITHVQQLARALHLLHINGYAHGAITLSNLVIAHAPVDHSHTSATPLLLTDPGSTDFVRNFGQPQTSVLPVTAAPEQAHKQASPASDQYALASVLYFWLTGRFPFLGSEEEILSRKLTETFISLPSLQAALTLEQDSIVRRALSAYPEGRFPSILAFAQALQASIPVVSAHTSAITLEQVPPLPPEPLPTPTTPEPLPPPGPDVPQPMPEPMPMPPLEPVPAPTDPTPVPQPEITPSPAPEEPVPPAPDIPQPLPPSEPPQPVTPPVEPVPAPTPAQPEITPPPTPEEPVPPEPDIPQPLPEPSEPPQPVTPPPSEPVQEIATDPYLLITSTHTNTSRELVLSQRTLTIGRAGSSDILLDDPLASRHHALLRFEESHYSISDQRSANGVLINGAQLAEGVEHTLTDGDVITVGQHEIVFCNPVQKRLETTLEDANPDKALAPIGTGMPTGTIGTPVRVHSQ